MDKMLELASEIGDIFSSSEMYKKYNSLFAQLETNEEFIRLLSEYRATKLNYYLTYSLNDIENIEEDIRINDMYNKLIQDKNVEEVLKLEDELLSYIAEIYKIIGDKCVLNVDLY